MFFHALFQDKQQPVQTVSQIVQVKLKEITNPVRDVTCMWIVKVTDTQRTIYRVVKKMDDRNIGTQQQENVPSPNRHCVNLSIRRSLSLVSEYYISVVKYSVLTKDTTKTRRICILLTII